VNRKEGKWIDGVKKAVGEGEGFDFILDFVVGNKYLNWDLEALRTEGRGFITQKIQFCSLSKLPYSCYFSVAWRSTNR